MRHLVHISIGIAATVCSYTVCAQQVNCTDRILSIREWKQTDSTSWTYSRKSSTGGALEYLGAQHKDDPAHEQFKNIATAFSDFKPTIAFFEGPDRGIAGTDTLTIQKFGESGYVRWLAKNAGIPALSLEPAINDTYQYLLSKYPHDQVDLYMFTKEASRLYNRKKMDKIQVTAAIQQMLSQVAAMLKDNKPVLRSTEEIEAAFKKHFVTTYEWWQTPEAWFDPADLQKENLFTNELAQLSSGYRNIYIVQLLARQVQEGKKVFAVIGRNHVPLQAPALDCAIR